MCVNEAPKKEKFPPPSSKPAKSAGGKQKKKKWSKGKQKEKVNNMVLFDNCDKNIIAEVETDVGKSTTGHDQNKCIKAQQAPLNTEDTGKEITSEEVINDPARIFFGYDGRECTCERTTRNLIDPDLLVESFEEPESPFILEKDRVLDMRLAWDYMHTTDPEATRLKWKEYWSSSYDELEGVNVWEAAEQMQQNYFCP